MTPHDLITAFDTLADAPDGTKRLRELVLSLAVRGKLVAQDAGDERAFSPARSTKKIVEPVVSPPFAVPPSWVWIRVVEAGTIQLGRQRSPENHRGPDMVPYLRVANVQEARLDLSDVKTMNFTPEEQERFRLSPGDVLLNEGQSFEFVGRPAIYRGEIPGCCFQNTLLRFRAFDETTPEYALIVFRSYMSSGEFRAVAQQTTNIAHLSAGRLAKVAFPLPPLAEQHRIVTRVDELMSLLDRLEAARTTRDEVRRAARDAALADLRDAPDADAVEAAWARVTTAMDDLFADPEDVAPLRQAVLQLAVRGRLVVPTATDGAAEDLLVRVGRELARQVVPLPANTPTPPGWSLVKLGDLIRKSDAGWSPKCEGFPRETAEAWGVLKTTAVQPNRYLEEHHKALPGTLAPRPEFEVAPGDLLVTRAGPSFRVGVAATVTATAGKIMLSDKIIRCRFPATRCVDGWLALAINHGPGSDFLRGKQTGMDAAQMNISQDRLRETPVLVPPLPEQHRIVAKVDALMAQCDALEAQLTVARDLHRQFAAAAVHHLDV